MKSLKQHPWSTALLLDRSNRPVTDLFGAFGGHLSRKKTACLCPKHWWHRKFPAFPLVQILRLISSHLWPSWLFYLYHCYRTAWGSLKLEEGKDSEKGEHTLILYVAIVPRFATIYKTIIICESKWEKHTMKQIHPQQINVFRAIFWVHNSYAACY